MTNAVNLLRSRPAFLWLAAASTPVGITFHHFLGLEPLLWGQPAVVLFAVLAAGIGVLLWIPFRSRTKLSKTARLALGLVVLSVVIQAILLWIRGEGIAYYWILLPVFVLLIYLKPASVPDVHAAFVTFFVVVVTCSVFVFVMFFVGNDAGAFDEQRFGVMRWAFMAEFGTSARWAGPFGNPNYAGPLGALTVVLGLCQRRFLRVFLVGGGLLMMLLSQSRSALLALIAGCLVLLLMTRTERSHRRVQTLTVAVGALSIIAVLVWSSRGSVVFGERPLIWTDFLDIWARNIWLGQGADGILEYFLTEETNSPLPVADAHNSIVDIAGRFGLLLLIPTVFALVLTVVVAFSASHRERRLALALIATMFVNGMGVALYSWTSFPIQTFPLLLVIALCGSAETSPRIPTSTSSWSR